MSGICGVCEPGALFHKATADAMLAALAVPGDLEREALAGRSVALGVSRRWPEQQLAHVPSLQIACNTDLIDLRELKAHVDRSGIDSTALTIAELLGWAYKFAGLDFVNLLSGAFAVALWDEEARRLVLAVDRIGINALYWSLDSGRLWFASRPGSIVHGRSTGMELEPAAIAQFLLFSTIPAPLSIYRGIERLEPGRLLVWDGGECRRRCYWDMHYEEISGRDERHWAGSLQENIRQAVYRHLEGCIPEKTGAYLSGGTDSSSVVAFMSERHQPVQTFSIFFDESRYSEIGFARTTADHFHTRHFEHCLTPAEAMTAIPRIAEFYDEPIGNSSAIGGYYCALLARQNGVDTLLGGDGGDELFAGNERYASDRQFQIYNAVPQWIRRALLEPAAKLLPQGSGVLSLPRRYIRRANIPNPERIFSYSFFLNCDVNEVFEPDFVCRAPRSEWLKIAQKHFWGPSPASELNRFLYMDVKMTLADNDIPKVSGTAELAGVRVRYPLLDHRLAEFSGRIPSRLKLRGFQKRYIFKRAMSGILPEKILFKKKHGFGVPLSSWFLRDPKLNGFMQEVLNDRETRQRGVFRPRFLEQLMDLHRSEHTIFYGELIWYLVAFELWHRHQSSLQRGFVFAR